MRLALHLENQQSVVFSATADLEDILSKLKHTTLTGWFPTVSSLALEQSPILISPISSCGINLSAIGRRGSKDMVR